MDSYAPELTWMFPSIAVSAEASLLSVRLAVSSSDDESVVTLFNLENGHAVGKRTGPGFGHITFSGADLMLKSLVRPKIILSESLDTKTGELAGIL